MATVDPRLFPLIETLVGAGADWLAFEVLEGLRLGRVPEEARDSTQVAPRAVWVPRPPHQPPSAPPAPTPIVGDEQIQWAADYVSKRMTDLVDMLDVTLLQLSAIVFREASRDIHQAADESIGILFEGDSEGPTSDRLGTEQARTMLVKLHEALSVWSTATRTGMATQ